MYLVQSLVERVEAHLSWKRHIRSVIDLLNSWNFEVQRLLGELLLTVVVELEVTRILTVHIAVVDLVVYLLVPLRLLLNFFEGLQGSIKGEEAVALDSTIVLNELPHLVILDDQQNVDLAHLRYFYGLFY